MKIFAVVPVKDTSQAKQRLAQALPPHVRQKLALAMFQDVIDTLTAVSGLAGIIVVTEDAEIARISRNYEIRVSADGARLGHTGAVTAAASLLDANRSGMLAIPADIPLVTPDDIERVLASHDDAPAFTIVPARDLQGSNCILCTPPKAVPLRFGDNSYFPHLDAAKKCGIIPREVRVPNIGLDIDTPYDLAEFLIAGSNTRTHRLLIEIEARKKATAR